jgi:hypothetical protein
MPGFPLGRHQIGIHRVSSLLCDLEPNRSAGLPLLDRGSLGGVPVRSHIFHAEPDQITGSKLTVYS